MKKGWTDMDRRKFIKTIGTVADSRNDAIRWLQGQVCQIKQNHYDNTFHSVIACIANVGAI